jgi:hypothetical protein
MKGDCRLWSQILNNFVMGQLPKVPLKDHKVVVVGLTRMLTQSDIMMQEPNVHTWYDFHVHEPLILYIFVYQAGNVHRIGQAIPGA